MPPALLAPVTAYRTGIRYCLEVRQSAPRCGVAPLSAGIHIERPRSIAPVTRLHCRVARSVRLARCLSSAVSTGAAVVADNAIGKECSAADQAESDRGFKSYKLVTFYCLTRVEDPHGEVVKHKAFCQARDIRGRIYINEQGVNAQLSGGGNDAEAYATWVTSDPRFAGTRVSVYDSPSGHAFPRLTLRYKSGLVQLEGGTQHLPVHDPSQRAKKLKPEEWHAMLTSASDSHASPQAPVVIDVRNGYEWDAGRFVGASRPPVESFRETVEAYSAPGGPLDGVPEDVPIMMYCTGGIRCDFYSAALRAKGVKNALYTLDGGVQAYIDACGPKMRPDSAWDGHLFVFDARLAMTGDKRASALVDDPAENTAQARSGLMCHCCGQPQAVAPHRNCPNVDCNRLFLVCPACLQSHGGFCCSTCSAATHIRPVLVQPGQRYSRYTHYVDGAATGHNNRRGEGRRLRKQRRKERRAQEQYEFTVAAVAETMARQAGLSVVDAQAAAIAVVNDSVMSGSAPGDASASAQQDGATLARRQRAARLAAAVSHAPEGVLGDSRFAKMRARLKEEAAARVAQQLAALSQSGSGESSTTDQQSMHH